MIAVPVASSANTEIKWAAELSHVREVSLVGVGDPNFWKTWLTSEGLLPAQLNGHAQILVTSAAGRFRGVRFRELSFSVMVSLAEQAAPAAFLIGAFNSSRVFAWCERVLFSTPYAHGDVRISTALPASIDLSRGGTTVFHASMRAAASSAPPQPDFVENGGWEGPVLLPINGGDASQRKLFFARVKGRTAVYPVVPDADRLTINPCNGDRVLGALRNSGFVAREWHIRNDASHAKSKTYRNEIGSVNQPNGWVKQSNRSAFLVTPARKSSTGVPSSPFHATELNVAQLSGNRPLPQHCVDRTAIAHSLDKQILAYTMNHNEARNGC
jgi:hypothetical protein